MDYLSVLSTGKWNNMNKINNINKMSFMAKLFYIIKLSSCQEHDDL